MGADADLVRRQSLEGFLAGDLGVMDELIADDFVTHDPPPGVPATKRGQLRLARTVAGAFADVRLERYELIDTVDGRVVEDWAMTGVHTGEAFGVPPSGRRVRVRGVDIFRCAGGRIVEHWGAVDMGDALPGIDRGAARGRGWPPVSSGATERGRLPMGADADLIRRLTDEGFLRGDVGVMDELIADDFVDHDPPPGMSGDKEGQRQILQSVASAFSDLRLEFDEMIDTADGRVVESWAMNAVHSGEAFGVPPSNQRVRVRGVEIWRCAGGKIVEHWGAVDMSDFFDKAAGAGG